MLAGRQNRGNGRGLSLAILAALRALACLVLVTIVAGAWSAVAFQAQETSAFPALDPERRVYDETGQSLTGQQVADLERQIADLAVVGADVVVYVRALDATPEQTLEQVEALQQAWVSRTGANQDTAVAILINRNPDDPNDARAGIYVGKTYHDGNVPEEEQRAIVDDALIPPLRDGDVADSLSDGLTRLESSIRLGPPRNAFERWADDVADGWFAWMNAGLALAGAAVAAGLYRTREHLGQPDLPATTDRPGTLTPALAGALVTGGPQVSAVPATLLDLAGRGALAIEPEAEGGRFHKPAIQVRLLDRERPADEVEHTLWAQLERRADEGVVSSKDLARIAVDSKDVRQAIGHQLEAAGWKNADARRWKAWLGVVLLIAVALAVLSVVVTIVAGSWLAAIGVVALVALAVATIVMLVRYSGLSLAGQEAARPWKAYRDGLKRAAKEPATPLDLDATLPDAVAMNLGSAMDKRLKDVADAGAGLRIFQSTLRDGGMVGHAAIFPYWLAFNSTVSTSSGTGTSSGTVSSGGSGGGGGAAGST